MSDNILRFVATHPEMLPNEELTQAAARLVSRAFPAADRVEVERHDGVRFIDCGSNLESVRCSSCGTDLLEGRIWSDLMEASWASGMTDRRVSVGCCDAIVALEDLEYYWPVAFGRFSIDVWNPDADWFHPDREPGEAEAALLADLAAAIGTPVRAIWSHI